MQTAQVDLQIELRHLRCEVRDLRKANARKDRSLKQLRTLVEKLKQENCRLKKTNKDLRQENVKLIQNQEKQALQLESLELIVEELRRMIFGKGKKKKKGKDDSVDDGDREGNPANKGRKKANRGRDSYRRPAPNEDDITATFKHGLTHCPDCGTLLTRLKEVIRYLEDLKDLSQLYKIIKRVEKHLIQTGYCPNCKKRKSASEISPQLCFLGEEVKKFIAYSITVQRQSFEQVKRFLWDVAKMSISDGEIVSALDQQAKKLIAERDRLLAKIRGDPGAHYDETGWKVAFNGQGSYAWVKTGTQSEEAVFLLGRSRGKTNAEELRGETDDQVGITDDYPAYSTMFKDQQLCWSHPNRKLKDLKNSDSLKKEKKILCRENYQLFGKLYSDLEDTLATDYDQAKWLKKREKYLRRLISFAVVKDNEPVKLRNIKEGLKRNCEKYFTCLTKPGIPADNNKAERKLRHLVLKRKVSFGSKTPKGADTMAILFSAVLSKWWSNPDNFFEEYNKMLSE